jgi:predicted lysophospholipase L1 biosynthesis ABC-type transport system permease subunit
VHHVRHDFALALRRFADLRSVSVVASALFALGLGFASFALGLARVYEGDALPYRDPARLVVIRVAERSGGSRGLTVAEFIELAARPDLFQGVAAYRWGPRLRLQSGERRVLLRTRAVSPNIFDVLGTRPRQREIWDQPAAASGTPMMLGEGQRNQFGWQIGDRVELPGTAGMVVAGVLADDFVFPDRFLSPTVYVPLDPAEPNQDTLRVIGRLPDRGPDLASIGRRAVDAMGLPEDARAVIESLKDELAERTARVAPGLHVMAALILAAAASTLTHLLLIATYYDSGQYATRISIGATTGQVASVYLAQIFTCLMVGLAAGALVVLGLNGLWTALLPAEYAVIGWPRFDDTSALLHLLVGTATMAMAAMPALFRILKLQTSPISAVQTRAPSHGRVRVALLAAQGATALAFVCVGAFVSLTYRQIARTESGFNLDAIVASVSYPPTVTADDVRALVSGTLDRLGHLPEINSVGAMKGQLFDTITFGTFVSLPQTERAIVTGAKFVAGDYFAASGVRLTAGRTFSSAAERDVGIVSEALTRKFGLAPGNAVGRTIHVGRRPLTVIGVATDVRDVSLKTEPGPVLYRPLTETSTGGLIHYVIQSRQPDLTTWRIEREIVGAEPLAVVVSLETVAAKLAEGLSTERAALSMLMIVSGCGLIMVIGGVGGAVSFLVVRGLREIAIRFLLGAPRLHLYRLVAGEALVGISLGSVLGVVGGWQLVQLAKTTLGGPNVSLAGTAALALAIVLTTTVIAAAYPLVRAIRETTLRRALY